MIAEINKKGKTILDINFDTDKSTILPDGKNKKLSAERANSVLNILVINGISKSNLKAIGFGSEKPLAGNDSEENIAKNRRVELVKF